MPFGQGLPIQKEAIQAFHSQTACEVWLQTFLSHRPLMLWLHRETETQSGDGESVVVAAEVRELQLG